MILRDGVFYYDRACPTISAVLVPIYRWRFSSVLPSGIYLICHLSICIDDMLGQAEIGGAGAEGLLLSICFRSSKLDLGPSNLSETVAASRSHSIGQFRVGPERAKSGYTSTQKPIRIIPHGALSVRLSARFRRARPPSQASSMTCLIIQLPALKGIGPQHTSSALGNLVFDHNS